MKWDKSDEYTVHDDRSIKGFQGEYRWLSNFFTAETEYEDMLFPSSENAYQAAKLMDPQSRVPFQTCTAAQSKKLWKTFPDFLRYDYWDEIKFAVMYDVVMDKFIRNHDLQRKLLATGNKYLEETNSWGDRYFGVCGGEGQNNLGKILMQVREEIFDMKLPF